MASHILALGVAPGVSEPRCGVVLPPGVSLPLARPGVSSHRVPPPGVSPPLGRPGVSSHRLADGVATSNLQG